MTATTAEVGVEAAGDGEVTATEGPGATIAVPGRIVLIVEVTAVTPGGEVTADGREARLFY